MTYEEINARDFSEETKHKLLILRKSEINIMLENDGLFDNDRLIQVSKELERCADMLFDVDHEKIKNNIGELLQYFNELKARKNGFLKFSGLPEEAEKRNNEALNSVCSRMEIVKNDIKELITKQQKEMQNLLQEVLNDYE